MCAIVLVSRTCANFDDAAETAPEIREDIARDVDGQPADPEHARGLVRASPSRHRLLELLDDSARRRGVERLPELREML